MVVKSEKRKMIKKYMKHIRHIFKRDARRKRMSSPSSSVVERQTFNLVVEGSIPSEGASFLLFLTVLIY